MDTKELQNFRQHASGVSRALWPADMRRSLATGRSARRQRPQFTGRRGLLATARRTALALVLISLFVGGPIAAALVLRLWYVLVIPTAILTVMTLLVAPPFLVKLRRTFNRPGLQHSRELRGLLFLPGQRRSPETPLPAAPLVRVLETYDLSQNSAEHFFDPPADQF